MARLFPAEEREYALGDLREEYAARVAESGERAARKWYWGQVVRSIGPLLTFASSGREDGGMNGVTRDLIAGLRQFRTSPTFTLVVVVTVAIGVGGATAVFSVLNGVVLRPLAFENSERVVTLWGQTSEYPRVPLTVGDHNELVHNVRSFGAVAGEWGNTALILGEQDTEQVGVSWVTPEYFSVLATVPGSGRLLGPEDVNAVVLNYDLWARRYGSDPSIIGRTINLSGNSMEIVGVLRQGDDPNLTSFGGGRSTSQVWRLQPADWTQGDDRSVGWLRSSARLADGVGLEQAQQEVDALFARVNATVSNRDGGDDLRIDVKPVRADLVGSIASTLWILLAAVTGVLLIAATNVANLMLGRTQRRRGEAAVRAALGGSRRRLFRQFFAESIVLALIGGALGVAVAWAGMKGLIAAAPPTLPRVDEVTLDPRVLGFAILATTVAAVLFGVIPALRGSKTDLASALGQRTATASRREQRLSRALVICEVALSLGLLVGTGLLLRSLQSLSATELGFEKENVLTFALETPSVEETAEAAASVLRDYMGRVEDVPGVETVGVTNRIPLAGGLFTGNYRSEEMVAAEAENLESSYRYVTPAFFDAMGARLLAGRSFTVDEGLLSVVVDRNVAERLWPGQDALGRRLEHTTIGADPVMAEVIGVVSPMKHAGVAEEAPPTIFLSMLASANQQNFRYMVVRTAGDPAPLVEPIRDALRLVDGDAVMARVRTMSALYSNSVASTRFAGQLLGVFGGVAMLLAAIGLHGVMVLSIRRRTREYGIRVALGAAHGTIMRGVLGAGLRMVVLGGVLGILLSLALARYLGSLLYGIEPADVTSLTAATVVIVGVGLLGSYLPARRVLRLDPVRTLRME